MDVKPLECLAQGVGRIWDVFRDRLQFQIALGAYAYAHVMQQSPEGLQPFNVRQQRWMNELPREKILQLAAEYGIGHNTPLHRDGIPPGRGYNDLYLPVALTLRMVVPTAEGYLKPGYIM